MSDYDNSLEVEPESEPEPEQEPESETHTNNNSITNDRSFLNVPISTVLFAPLKALTLSSIQGIQLFEYVFNRYFLNEAKTDFVYVSFKSDENNSILIPLLAFFTFPLMSPESLNVKSTLCLNFNYENRRGETYNEDSFVLRKTTNNSNGVSIIDNIDNGYQLYTTIQANELDASLLLEYDLKFKSQDPNELSGFMRVNQLMENFTKIVQDT